jgi:excisionase family DNA binding protein
VLPAVQRNSRNGTTAPKPRVPVYIVNPKTHEVHRMEREKARPAESLWTWSDVAAFLRIGRNAVYEMAANRDLPSLRLGSRVRFVPEEVRAWLDSQRGPGRGGAADACEGRTCQKRKHAQR